LQRTKKIARLLRNLAERYTIKTMIELETINKKHIPLVQKYASNPLIGETSNVPSAYPSDGAEFWFSVVEERMKKSISKVFAINEERQFCGIITLNSIDHIKKIAELDYWVAVEYQNRGIASKAVSLAIDHARNRVGLTTLMSGCLNKNPASGRVLEKNGFSNINNFVIGSGKFKGEKMKRFMLKLDDKKINHNSFFVDQQPANE